MSEYRLAIVIDANGKPAVAAMNELTGAVSRTEAVVERVVADTKASGQAAQASARQWQDMARACGVTSSALGQVDQRMTSTARALGQVRESGAGAVSTMRSLVQTAAALAGVTLGAAMLGQVTALVDGYTNMTSKLRLVTDSEAQLLQVRRELFDVSQDTRANLSATTDLYTRLDRSTAQLGTTQTQLLQLTETINQSFVVSGASAEEASAAIIQLSQGLASGALRGDEFNSVAEQAPILMDLLAKSLGVTRGELRGMAEDGKLTADVMVNALLEGGAQVDAMFGQMELTIGGASTQLVNAFQQWVGQGNEALGASRLVAEGISLLASNLGGLANLVGVVAVAWGTRYVAGVVASTRATVAARVAAVQLTAAELAEAQAAEVATVAQLNRARAIVNSSGVTSAAIAAENAFAAAQVRTAAAATASAAAMTASTGLLARMGSGLLALAGGPIGVSVLAVGSLAYGLHAVTEAELERQREFDAGIAQLQATTDQVEQLSAAIAELDRPPPPLAEQLRAAADATAQLLAAQADLQRMQRDVEVLEEALTGPGLSDSRFLNMSNEAQRLREEISALTPTVQQLERATGSLAADLSSRFAPSLGIATEAINAMMDAAAAGDGGGVWSALVAGIDDIAASVSRITEADQAAQRLFAELQSKSKEASTALQTAGKSAEQVATELVELAEAQATAAGWSQEQITRLKAEGSAYLATVVAIDKAKNAAREATTARREQERADRAATKVVEEHERALIEQAAVLGEIPDQVAQYRLALLDAERQLREQIAAGLDASAAHREYANAVQIAGEAAQDAAVAGVLALTDELEEQDSVLRDLTRRYDEHIRLAQMGDRERRIEQASLAAIAEWERVHRERIDATTEAMIRRQVVSGETTLQLIEDSQRAAEETQRQWEQVSQATSGALGEFAAAAIFHTDDIGSAFEDLGDNLVRTAERAVADMIAEFAQLQLINPMLNAIFGVSLPTGGGGGGFNLGSFAQMFSGGASGTGGFSWANISSLGGAGGGNMFSSALGAFTGYGQFGTAAGWTAAAANGPPAALAGAGGASAGGMGAMAAVPIIGWIIAAMMANDAMYGQGWRYNGAETMLPNGQRIRGGGDVSAFGELMGLGGAVGVSDRLLSGIFDDRTASILSGSALHTRLWGRRAPRVTNGEMTFDFGAEGGVGGTERYRTLEEGGLFRSDRRRWHEFDLGGEALESAQAMFDALRQVMVDASRQLQADAPAMIDAALRVVSEYDKKGKVTATRYFVDLLGRSWEEATAEAAQMRLLAEATIASIDAAMGNVAPGVGEAIVDPIVDAIIRNTEPVGERIGEMIERVIPKTEVMVGEASAIAERWRSDAEDLAEGAEFLLSVATDIRNGFDLLGTGTLMPIVELIEDLAEDGESLISAYARAAASTQMLEDALELMGRSLDISREDFVRLALDITAAAGGIDQAAALWGNYFETYYSEQERALLRLENARDRATTLFEAVGLSLDDFTGEGGLERLRELLEERLPTATATEINALLLAAQALGIVVNAQNAYTAAVGATTDTLVDAVADMSSLDEALRIARERRSREATYNGPDYGDTRDVPDIFGPDAGNPPPYTPPPFTPIDRDDFTPDWGGSPGTGIDEVQDEIDRRYQLELDWLERLRQWDNSVLLDESVSTLTPEERIAEAERQYADALSRVQSADPALAEAARDEFSDIRDELLRIGRDSFGSSQAYTDLFDRLRADNAALMAASPASLTSTAVMAALYQANSSAVVLDVQPVTAAIRELRSDQDAQMRAVLDELRQVNAELREIKQSASRTARNTEAPTNGSRGRVNA